MSSEENTEVYIPKDACVSKIRVQCLPVSIARKMGIRPSTRDPERSANSSCHLATWICPVELREKGTSAFKTSQMHRFLTQGHVSLPLFSSNPTVSKVLKNFFASSKSTLQDSDPYITVSCSRVSRSRQNAVILYDGQIFLSVRKKFLQSGQLASKHLVLPVPVSQKDLLKAQNLPSPSDGMQLEELNNIQKKALLLPQVSSRTVKPPQEQHECGAAAEFCSSNDPRHRIVDHTEKQSSETSGSRPDEGIRDTVHVRKSKRGDDQTDKDGGNEEEPMGRETGFSSNEEHEKKSDVCVYSEPVENVSEGGMQVDGQLNGVDNDQRFSDESYVEDVNMNIINEKDLNVASENISNGDKLLEHMENEADSFVTLEAVEGCEINGHSLPAKAQNSEFHTYPVISHVTSLAKDWNDDVGVKNEESLCYDSEKPNPEIFTPSRTVEVQAPPLETRPQENGETRPQENGETSPQETGETSPLETGETSPLETGETSPLETGETSPLETGETSPLETGETSPLETGETSPLETGETSPLETGETSLQENGETSLQENGETSLLETGETSLQENGETSLLETGETSPQETGEELLPCLTWPLENHRLDFKELEQLEKISRIRNALRKMEAKLETVNWKK